MPTKWFIFMLFTCWRVYLFTFHPFTTYYFCGLCYWRVRVAISVRLSLYIPRYVQAGGTIAVPTYDIWAWLIASNLVIYLLGCFEFFAWTARLGRILSHCTGLWSPHLIIMPTLPNELSNIWRTHHDLFW